MARIIQAPWLAALLGTVLYLLTTFLLLNRVSFHVPSTQSAADLSPDNDPSWHFHNPEFDQWVAQIRTEKENLDQRELQLKDLQTRLNAERAELMTVTQTVYKLQEDFDKNVVRFTADQIADAKRQTKVVADMSPDGAARMMNEMPDDKVLPLLFSLKPDQSGAILDAMSQMGRLQAARAADLTMQMRRVLSTPTNAPAATTP